MFGGIAPTDGVGTASASNPFWNSISPIRSKVFAVCHASGTKTKTGFPVPDIVMNRNSVDEVKSVKSTFNKKEAK